MESLPQRQPWYDDRPSFWGSRVMWAGGLLGGAFVFCVDRVGSVVGLTAMSIAFPLLVVVLVVAAIVYVRTRSAVLSDPTVAASVRVGGCVVALSPREAFDAVERALRAIPGARIDAARTDFATATAYARTRWTIWGYGSVIEVHLFRVDDDHVGVIASCLPRYRGTYDIVFSQRPLELGRLFGALPIDRPHDPTWLTRW